MALTYSAGGGAGSDFEPVPAGTHAAVCSLVCDVGLQPGSARYPKPKPQVWLRFEIPSERVKWTKDGVDYDKPAIVYEKFTASVAPRSLLRAALEAWYARSFTDEEAARIDITKVAGRPALISIVHNQVGDKVYANISTIAPLIKGMAAPVPENPVIVYHAGATEQHDELPKFLQEKIAAQLEPEAPVSKGGGGHVAMEDEDVFKDDIPFITCGRRW